ncbi:AraC family transcriptional regulator [Paenibacillus sp. BC26]|uniref:AraC family transcriptional regulator n=1 Tax=Paenibacillus sp. BC26 TaxID=1881032 RepID=UPI0008E8B5CE|nr:AraC family transcriptional regulator [Paenibacillus sp. BC26]SFS56333.1 hypothetical protein SAMN05428962_0870 [Paenibacillus sp. BC26]
MRQLNISVLPEKRAQLVGHAEMKLIGIPCIGLQDMGSKFRHAKESLLGLAAHMPQIMDASVQYGMWPQAAEQDVPNTHAYLLSVEVTTFEGIPEWFARMTVPAQSCVVAASQDGDFEGAGEIIDAFIATNALQPDPQPRDYIICERYRYNAEGFARYSYPILMS